MKMNSFLSYERVICAHADSLPSGFRHGHGKERYRQPDLSFGAVSLRILEVDWKLRERSDDK